jgi:peptidoglycan/LPS O-acetylase OafA/YrhL
MSAVAQPEPTDETMPRWAADPPRPSRRPARIAGLNGVRALAALAVVVHHAASVSGSTAGSAAASRVASVLDGGVAVFFVLSGFLIYRPFADGHLDGTGGPLTGPYVWRRLVRIVPAYWAALTILWIVGVVSLGNDWWRYYAFAQSYSRSTALGGIVPAWTLNVEVAFYLFVPLWAAAVRWTARRSGLKAKTAELAGCAALALAAAVMRALVSAADPVWRGLSFQWLPTNVDLFAAGMAISIVAVGGSARAHKGKAPWDAVGWTAAAVVFAGYAVMVGGPTFEMLADPNGAYIGLFWQRRQLVLAVVAVLIVAPLVLAPRPARRVDRGLVAWVGVVSYGLYLWHLPVMEAVAAEWRRHSADPVPFAVVLVVGALVGLGAAAASWHLIERPVLERAGPQTAPIAAGG